MHALSLCITLAFVGLSPLALSSRAVAAEVDAPAAAPAGSSLPLNHASVEELASLDQVEPGEAEAIVRLREQRGRLHSVEALRVLDLDEPTMDALRMGTHMDMSVTKVANDRRFTSVQDVLAQFSGEPSAQRVQELAMDYTKTHPGLVEGWLSSSRTAYLLPKVNLKYKKELDYSDTNKYEEDIDNPGDYVEYDYQDRADNDDEFEVKLEWRLDKLVISSERIRVINEAQDIVKLRDKVLEEVTRLYFDRRRLQVELLLDPPSALADQLESELRLQEATANLDAFTGGAFSASLPR